MSEIEWYHSIDLGPALGVTPGSCKDDAARLRYMSLPASLENQDVLDIGSWDGYFAFAAEARGARSVLATDIWGDYQIVGLQQCNRSTDGILFAAEVLKSNVKTQYSNVYDLCETIWAKDPEYLADVVIFPGVLYHLKEPMRALAEIYRIMAPGGLLILETHLDLMKLLRPAVALYRSSECNRDETNYCGPNPAAVEVMLTWAGFHSIQFQGGINLDAWPDLQTVNQARGAWHARK